jgi:hypothetical protein
MQHCQFCGSELSTNSRFCGNCGRTQSSSTAFETVSHPSALPSPPPIGSMNTVVNPPPQKNPPVEDDEEERRRGVILPMPTPVSAEGPPVGGQVPTIQGTPSLSNVPTVQGTPPGITKAASPTHTAGSAASKATMSATTKWILFAVIGVIVVAGSAGALAYLTRSHPSSPGGSTPVTSGKSTTISSSNRNASATACTATPGFSCSSTASPSSTTTASPSSTVSSGQPTGTFSFAGAVSGPLVISSLKCGFQGKTYVMQTIGAVGGKQYKFLIGIPSFNGPGTYTSNLTVDLISGSGASTTALANDGRYPVSITITNGGKAGKVSSDLEGVLNLSNPQLSKGHVSGSWTCS